MGHWRDYGIKRNFQSGRLDYAMSTGFSNNKINTREDQVAKIPSRRFAGKNGPTPIDLLFQLGYIMAYRLLLVWWFFTHPRTQGAICAVWCADRVLLVRSPYRPYYSFPGGFIKRRETGLQAARRELAEEVNISIAPEQLTFSRRSVEARKYREENTEIFEIEMDIEPPVRIDYREIVVATFFTSAQALQLNLLPAVREYILDKVKSKKKSIEDNIK